MTKLFWLTVEDIIAIHSEQIATHGGQDGLRDRGLLKSAVRKPLNLCHYSDASPDIAELAASYAFGIVRNHPFFDGNKRAALIACRSFLKLNGFDLIATPVEKYDKTMRLAEGMLSEREFADWLLEKTEPIEKGEQIARKLQEK